MEYIHSTGAEVHYGKPNLPFTLTDNALTTDLPPEELACSFFGFDIANPYYLHHFPPKTLFEYP
jgi:hypothetical protein